MGNVQVHAGRWPHAPSSNAGDDGFLEYANNGLIALIERPLLDPFGAQQPCLRQHLEVFARGRWADPELRGDEYPTDAVRDQVAVDLGRKVGRRILQPRENMMDRADRYLASQRARSIVDGARQSTVGQ